MKSTKCFSLGTTIYDGFPFVFLLSRSNRGELCDGCFKKTKLTSCHKCLTFKYCSGQCQSNNIYLHEHECRILESDPSKLSVIGDDALFLLRLYCHSQSSVGKDANEEILEEKRKFSDLMSNAGNIINDEKRCDHFAILSAQIKAFVGDSLPLPDSKHLLSTFGKMVTNSFSILDDDINPMGSGLYLGASILNHSCDPNCAIVFSGIELHLKPIKDITENDELTISYIEQMNTTKRRQEELSNLYYFKCGCNHCCDLERDTRMTGLKSDKEEYRNSIEEEFIKMEKEAQSLKVCRGAQKMYDLAKRSFSKWSDKLQAQSIYIYKCLDVYFDACIDLGMWDKVRNIGSKMIKIHSSYIQGPHPKRAVDSLKYAKILLLLTSYKKAMEYFNKAESEITVLYGGDSSLAQVTQKLKFQCSVEGRL